MLKWSEPIHPNGMIKQYNIKWCENHGSKICKNVSMDLKLSYEIESLRPGTTYDISVSAFTEVGEGPADSKQAKTKDSGKIRIK